MPETPANPTGQLRAAADRLRAPDPAIAPDVGHPLADWLDAEASRLEVAVHPDRHEEYGRHALAVARQILGEDDR